MDKDELEIFRDRFKQINISDPYSLRAWFEDYPELTTKERSQISDKKPSTIGTWKRRAGLTQVIIVELDDKLITMRNRRKPHFTPKKAIPNIEVPPNWDSTPGWVQQQHRNGVSITMLTRLLKCSARKIRRLIHGPRRIPKYISDIINEL